jgi:type 1 fimbriae regulatory protein FimB
MIERAGEAAGLPFPVHVHMLRHSTGYALAGRGMDTRRLQHYLGHASITNTLRYTAMSPAGYLALIGLADSPTATAGRPRRGD